MKMNSDKKRLVNFSLVLIICGSINVLNIIQLIAVMDIKNKSIVIYSSEQWTVHWYVGLSWYALGAQAKRSSRR